MSGTVIITKFSNSTQQPAQDILVKGEQAYSYSSNKLWIGDSSTPVNAIAVGGVFFTDQLKSVSSQFGSVAANQAIVTGSDNKIDLINIDNITIDGNTITTTDANGDLVISPNGSGELDVQGNTNVVGSLTVSGTTALTGALTVSTINVTDLTDNRVLIAGPLGEIEDSGNLTFNGTTLVLTGSQTISGTLDVNGQTTLASLNVEDLTSTRVTFAGALGELSDSANLTWGSNTLNIAGTLNVDNVRVDGNIISATNADGSLTLTPNGQGNVIIDSSKALVIAMGDGTTRPGAVTIGDGAIRYNTASNRFEGTSNGSWTGLGGVVDRDQDTYVTAEIGDAGGFSSLDDDTLRFIAAGTQEMTITSAGVDVTDQITTPIANITTANTTTENVGTINVSTQMQVNADANFAAGIDVTAGDVDISDNLNVQGNAVVEGNLTVRGVTTSVESTVTTLNDPVIKVGAGSTIAVDLIDRGVNFDYGDGNAVKTGFFGFDNATSRFSFKPIVDTADENYVAPWGDAQFGALFLSGDATVADNLVLSANGIVTTAGDLTIAPAGGDTFITGTTTISSDLTVQGNVTFDNDVPVTSGGTGMSGFTGNGVMVANAAGTAMTFVTGTQYDIIQFNASGVPVASNVIDGGTF